jgi:type II secretory pathway pseudopilin PulG
MPYFFQNNKIKGDRGFSGIETLVVVLVMLMLFMLLIQFYISYRASFSVLSANYDVGVTAGVVISETTEAIRLADKVIASRTISGTAYTTGANTLILELPSIDNSGNILIGKVDYLLFYITGSNIYKVIDPDASSSRKAGVTQLSGTATSFILSYDNGTASLAKRIEVDVQTSKTANNKTETAHLHDQVYLRNK